MAKVTQDIAREHERAAWRLRCKGFTQERIASELNMAQSSICEMLQRVEKRLAVEFREQAEEMKARQTAQLEQVMQEALLQWQRSCEDGVTEVTVKGKVTGKGGRSKKGAEKDESRAQVTRTVEGQTGNPALLEKAMKAMEGIRSIWGLDAPKKQEHTGPDGEPFKVYLTADDSDWTSDV